VTVSHKRKPADGKTRLVERAEVKIGVRLKHARLTKGLTLREVADLVGCSESFVSKVENDKIQPSLAMLHRLVAALEINVTSLFAESEPDAGPVAIMRGGSRPVIRMDPEWQGNGIALERLVPQPKGSLLQANIHHVAPNGSSDGVIEHAGEELGFVLEGRLELVVDNVVYLVSAGDSCFFRSSLPHGYRNKGSEAARILWVNTPPSF
jgi:transcriptional regulator with XRE-family HTH domain